MLSVEQNCVTDRDSDLNIDDELQSLYERRAVIDNLIACLEDYERYRQSSSERRRRSA